MDSLVNLLPCSRGCPWAGDCDYGRDCVYDVPNEPACCFTKDCPLAENCSGHSCDLLSALNAGL